MKKLVWIYGLIAGAIVSTFMAFSSIRCCSNPERMMSNSSMILGFLAMFISFSFIFVGVKAYRDKYQNGVISFGKAFGMGLLIALLASSIYVITWAFVYHFAIPNFMDVYTEHMIKLAKASGDSAEVKEKIAGLQKGREMYHNPVYFTLITYAEILPVGIFMSLLAALILRRKKPLAAAA